MVQFCKAKCDSVAIHEIYKTTPKYLKNTYNSNHIDRFMVSVKPTKICQNIPTEIELYLTKM